MQYIRVEPLQEDTRMMLISYDARARQQLGCVISAMPKIQVGQRVQVNSPLFILETHKRKTRVSSPIAGIVTHISTDIESIDKTGHLNLCTITPDHV
jgi:glycine cleavage system H lipoate-binding protein